MSCRKFAPTARNYLAAKLMSQVGLRVKEACNLDLADVKWELSRFGKLYVRVGKGARCSGPRERMVPLINGADATLRWFIADVRATSTTTTPAPTRRYLTWSTPPTACDRPTVTPVTRPLRAGTLAGRASGRLTRPRRADDM